jgi:hypothetical protein
MHQAGAHPSGNSELILTKVLGFPFIADSLGDVRDGLSFTRRMHDRAYYRTRSRTPMFSARSCIPRSSAPLGAAFLHDRAYFDTRKPPGTM